MLNVYMEDKNKIFSSYIESELVNIIDTKPEHYALIESKPCACNSRNGTSVQNSSIIIKNLDNYIKGYENYILNCQSEEEIKTVIFWLLKSNFYTFSSRVENRKYKRNLSERFFYIYYKTCGCIEYELRGEPIYCLKSIVVSSRKTGPTVKSVI